MGSYSIQHSCGHRVKPEGDGRYLISWFVVHGYPQIMQSKLYRHQRITDAAGAKRFCKKWGLPDCDAAPIVPGNGG